MKNTQYAHIVLDIFGRHCGEQWMVVQSAIYLALDPVDRMPKMATIMAFLYEPVYGFHARVALLLLPLHMASDYHNAMPTVQTNCSYLPIDV